MSPDFINFRQYGNFVFGFVHILINLLSTASHVLESFMFFLMGWYDLYMYTPLQVHLSPHIAKIPRFIRIGKITITIFNANIVTYSRTFLIIPIAWLLKYDHNIWACLLVIIHDFLDHVDGIVAKTQKRIYGEIDDPLLGGFMDAFCDKIVNIFCLWSILQETDFSQTSYLQTIAFICLCYTIIGLETAIGIVRVQDYFHASINNHKPISGIHATASAMEGKLKEKLESMGLAFLCLSTGHSLPFSHWSGIMGIICFSLTVRLAYASLAQKLRARKKIEITVTKSEPAPFQRSIGIINGTKWSTETVARGRAMTLGSAMREPKRQTTPPSTSPSGSITNINVNSNNNNNNTNNPFMNGKSPEKPRSKSPTIQQIKEEDEEISDEDIRERTMTRSASLPAIWIDGRADKVYTIGCFDLFHEGHRLLLLRMRQFGREVIVGVHDSRSIYKLKQRVPVDGTERRMLNVKQHADQVYCVSATDPSAFVTCIVHLKEDESALYVRGDDMADFPSRHVVEELMPVRFLPYTHGVSSTKLRQELYSHINSDDLDHLEKVN